MTRDRRPNFARQIEEVAGGEDIEAVIIREPGDCYYGPDRGDRDPALFGRLLPWATARPLLDYEYDDGYGGVECDAIHAWTESRVIFVGCYDGASWVDYVPRNPAREPTPDTVGSG